MTPPPDSGSLFYVGEAEVITPWAVGTQAGSTEMLGVAGVDWLCTADEQAQEILRLRQIVWTSQATVYAFTRADRCSFEPTGILANTFT